MQTILVVEDNNALRENTKELLELAGYKVITAIDGKEGLQKTIEHRPNLILCDLAIPKAGGMELLINKIKNKRIREIPIVFLSAGSLSIQNHQEYNADAYLSKPYTYEQLLETVHQFLLPGRLS